MNGRSEQVKALHDLIGMVENPPSDECLTIAYAIENFLSAYADNGDIDTGFGFGESCLDFCLDGKGLRVVISSQPNFDLKV